MLVSCQQSAANCEVDFGIAFSPTQNPHLHGTIFVCSMAKVFGIRILDQRVKGSNPYWPWAYFQKLAESWGDLHELLLIQRQWGAEKGCWTSCCIVWLLSEACSKWQVAGSLLSLREMSDHNNYACPLPFTAIKISILIVIVKNKNSI